MVLDVEVYIGSCKIQVAPAVNIAKKDGAATA